MNLIPVVSSNVSAIGYENGVIEVHFHNGYAYRYPNCTEQLFNDFLNAPSKDEAKSVFVNPNLPPMGLKFLYSIPLHLRP